MFPGGNNYNPGYPQPPGYNPPTLPYGVQRGPPIIGFNVSGGMGEGVEYPPMQPQSYGGSYPNNPQSYASLSQGYNVSPSQGYNPPIQQGYDVHSSQGYDAQAAQGYNVPAVHGYNGPSLHGYNGPPTQGYNAPQAFNTFQPLCEPRGQSGMSYSQSQLQATEYSQMHGAQKPIEIQSTQGYPKGSDNTNNQINPSHVPSSNYDTNVNNQMIMNSIGSGGETYKGTMKPHTNFNAESDSNILKKAMKGIGTDEKTIIECLGRRNLAQRLEIKKTFKTMFGKDLIDELKSELSGNFSRAVIESLYDSDYYNAYSLHKAMEGAGTREDVLTEILTSRSNQEINNIKELYKKWYKKDLEKEVISETSGFYKRVLVSCLQANKKELTGEEIMRLRQHGPSAIVNAELARQEAQELYNAGEKKVGTDEACFIKIFASRNKYQLRATFDEYKKVSSRDILTSIEREMSGDLASSLKAIALQAIDPAQYFATRLYKSMKGLGTNDTALIRILLTRSEIDLDNIKIEFQKQYKKTLESFIRGDTSGDYQKYLMRFVEGN